MLIIPAIDLLKEKVVRLSQGTEETATVYSNDPLKIALDFQKAGAHWIHVVDLDGAFGRPETNDTVIKQLTRTLSIPIELGGGIRSLDRISFWLNQGVGRVILGSVAVKNPEIVKQAINQYGSEPVVVGIDIRAGKVAVHGWQENTQTNYIEIARKMKSFGLQRTIVTDIATDGMLTGPKLDAMINIAQKTDLAVIASGGVSSLKDLEYIAEYSHQGIEGAIIGRAIYEKKFTVKQAIDKFQKIT